MIGGKVSLFYFLVAFVKVCYGSPLQQSSQTSVYSESSRIVGGVDATPGFAPYTVALLIGSHVVSLVCGGSIITTRLVLTAAHCVLINDDGEILETFHGTIGSNQWNSDLRVYFKDHTVHPEFDLENIKNDVAVLLTESEMVLSDVVKVIPLSWEWVDGEQNTHVAGWGKTDRIEELESGVISIHPISEDLQVLHLQTINPEECIQHMKNASVHLEQAPDVTPDIEICTFHSFGHGVCSGDSGSALVLEETMEQIGVVSWGFPCARGFPDVYARISGFKDFLEQIFTAKS